MVLSLIHSTLGTKFHGNMWKSSFFLRQTKGGYSSKRVKCNMSRPSCTDSLMAIAAIYNAAASFMSGDLFSVSWFALHTGEWYCFSTVILFEYWAGMVLAFTKTMSEFVANNPAINILSVLAAIISGDPKYKSTRQSLKSFLHGFGANHFQATNRLKGCWLINKSDWLTVSIEIYNKYHYVELLFIMKCEFELTRFPGLRWAWLW